MNEGDNIHGLTVAIDLLIQEIASAALEQELSMWCRRGEHKWRARADGCWRLLFHCARCGATEETFYG